MLGNDSKLSLNRFYSKAIFLLIILIFLLFSNGRYSLFFTTWISATFLLSWVRGYSTVKGFLWAWLIISVAWAFQFYGMVPVPTPIFLIIVITYGLIGSMPYFLELLLNKKRHSFLTTLIFPSCWAIVDYLTQFTPYGSWGHAAYSQHSQLVLLQSVSVFGMSYITFLIGWFASICNWIYHHNFDWNKIYRGVAVYGILFIFTLAFGSIRMVFQRPTGNTVRIASLSADKKQDQKTDPALLERFFANQLTDQDIENFNLEAKELNQNLLDRSVKEAKAGAKIIFWGEANGTALKNNEEMWFNQASQLAIEYNIYMGMGLGTLDPSSSKPLENKLVLFEPTGKKIIDYWKAIPVPGGESGISATKGRTIQTVETEFGTIGTVICFDMDFPRHLSQASEVDILIVPSNDWKAIDPWHTHMSRFRAIEQGFNMVRHTSNGLSVGADYTGRVISEMDHYMSEEKILITHLPTKGVTTVYSIIGDTFPLLCFLTLIMVVIKNRRQPKLNGKLAG